MRPRFALLLLLLSPAAWAGMIYDNGLPVTSSTLACASVCPDLVTGVGRGVFTLLSDATLASARFWTFQVPGAYNGGTLGWGIYLDNSGTQGSLIGSGTFCLSSNAACISQTLLGAVNVAGLNLNEYQNDFAIPSLAIHAASHPQSYFLNLSDTSGLDTFGNFWATSGQNILAFQLSGTGTNGPIQPAPEPATFVLLAGGLALVIARHAWLQRRAIS